MDLTAAAPREADAFLLATRANDLNYLNFCDLICASHLLGKKIYVQTSWGGFGKKHTKNTQFIMYHLNYD